MKSSFVGWIRKKCTNIVELIKWWGIQYGAMKQNDKKAGLKIQNKFNVTYSFHEIKWNIEGEWIKKKD